MKKTKLLACLGLPIWLAGCALTAPPESVTVQPPNKWFAPLPAKPTAAPEVENLPHHGTLTDLSKWWEQQNDPLLVELIQSAQTVSPTVATAVSRIEQSLSLIHI